MTKTTTTKILYVEDDETLSLITKENLESHGYEVIHADKGGVAYNLAMKEPFDLYILDIMLPEMDGFSLATKIRQKDPHVPIIFLSAKSMKEDRIKGLKLGADDYITKPYSIEELILRIEVFLRRSKFNHSVPLENPALGKFTFDYANYTLKTDTEEIVMTQREADLLNFLLKRKNQVIKRSDILESIWGEDDYFMGRSLDVFISRLRKYFKSEDDIKIENVHGVGFKLKC